MSYFREACNRVEVNFGTEEKPLWREVLHILKDSTLPHRYFTTTKLIYKGDVKPDMSPIQLD